MILTVAAAAIFSAHSCGVGLLVVERSGFVEHAREFIATLYIMVASGMSHIRRSPLSYYLLSSCFFFTFFSSYNSLLPPFFSSFLISMLSLSLARSCPPSLAPFVFSPLSTPLFSFSLLHFVSLSVTCFLAEFAFLKLKCFRKYSCATKSIYKSYVRCFFIYFFLLRNLFVIIHR